MARTSPVINALTRKYAELLGQFVTVDRRMEDVVGLDNYDEELAFVDRTKLRLRAKLSAIYHVALLFDPTWDPKVVKPKKPRREPVLARRATALALQVLRKADRPLKAREIAHGVVAAANMGKQPEETTNRIEIAIRSGLRRYVELGWLRLSEDSPMRWSLIPRGERRP